jgi:hypothetical protein
VCACVLIFCKTYSGEQIVNADINRVTTSLSAQITTKTTIPPPAFEYTKGMHKKTPKRRVTLQFIIGQLSGMKVGTALLPRVLHGNGISLPRWVPLGTR